MWKLKFKSWLVSTMSLAGKGPSINYVISAPQKFLILLIKKTTKREKGVRNRRFWDNIVYGWPLSMDAQVFQTWFANSFCSTLRAKVWRNVRVRILVTIGPNNLWRFSWHFRKSPVLSAPWDFLIRVQIKQRTVFFEFFRRSSKELSGKAVHKFSSTWSRSAMIKE